ncbi:MAG: hypothetical protein R2814_04450 [Flavobacteriaceae bacterium]
MKNKILLLCFMVLLVNCEKEDQVIKSQEIDSGTPISVTSVTADGISDIIDLIGTSSDKVSKSGFISTPSGEVVMEDIIKVVDTMGNTNYSFLLLPEKNSPNSIFNLVVSTSKNSTPNMAIIEYRMDDNFVKGFMEGTKDFSEFSGTLYSYPFSSYSELFSKDTCVQNIDEVVICDETILNVGGSGGGSGGGGGTGDPIYPIGSGGGSGSGSGSGTIITVNWVCDWRGSSHDSPNECTGPGGGGGPGRWVITIIRVPYSHTNKGSVVTGKELTCCDDSYVEGTVGVNLTVEAISEIINCIGLLNADQINALNIDGRKTISLKNFLTADQCSEASIEQGTEMIGALAKGSLVSWFPFIKYPDSKAAQYKRDYPKLTEYLKNQLPKVANISKITNAIRDITGLSLEQIKYDLKWDQGPVVEIVQLDNHCGQCNEDTVGRFDKTNPNILLLDIDFVNRLENDITLQQEEDAFMFFLGTTILHEYVHLGDFNNGDNYKYPLTPEEGVLFEVRVYGQNVHDYNAIQILFKD